MRAVLAARSEQGRRLAKEVGGAVTEADVYNTAGQVVSRYGPYPTETWLGDNVWVGGAHLAIYANGQTYFPVTDQVGTERARFASTGGIVESCVSLPFGDGLQCTGTDSDPYHFAKLERDAESGDDHAQHRNYNSIPGRWLSPDPAGTKVVSLTDPQTWNLYVYSDNNPVTDNDPSGLQDCNHDGPCYEKGGPMGSLEQQDEQAALMDTFQPPEPHHGHCSRDGCVIADPPPDGPGETTAEATCIILAQACAAVAAVAAEAAPYVAAAALAGYLGYEMLHPQSVCADDGSSACPSLSFSKDTAGGGPDEGKDRSTQAGREEQLAGVNATRDARTKAAGSKRRLGYRIDSSGSEQTANKGLKDMRGKSLGEIEKEEEGQ